MMSEENGTHPDEVADSSPILKEVKHKLMEVGDVDRSRPPLVWVADDIADLGLRNLESSLAFFR